MKFKLHISKILLFAVAIITVSALSTHTAHAAGLWDFTAGALLLPGLNAVIGGIASFLLTLAGLGLSLTGTLLNVSMFLTTHLGMFIDQTSAVYTVWGILRDLSSIVLIFFILYASIQMITGLQRADYGHLITQIIIVGILINFSFFFTRVMIDASNIVSLQFYNAIAPENTASSVLPSDMTSLTGVTKKLLTSGGVSNAIMGQLNVTGWWSKSTSGASTANQNTATASGSASDGLNLVLVAAGGIVVSTITILSFVAISAAAILRIAMLIFLIAFSPVWVASWAMPGLKQLTKQWSQQFYAQLVFLPVYLAFLYVALRIITELRLNSVTNANIGTVDLGNAINLFVGFGICIVMLTIPMIAAIGVTSAVGGDSGMIEKFSNTARGWARTATVGAAGAAGGWTARNSVGRIAAAGDKYLSNTKSFGASVLGRDIRSATIGKVAASKFGTGRSVADYKKESKEAERKGNEIERRTTIEGYISNTKSTALASAHGAELKKINEKEKLGLGADTLKNTNIIKHLKSSDFEAIKKSDDFTDDEKKAIDDARLVALKESISRGTSESEQVKHMMNNMDEKDLLKLDPAELQSDVFVAQLTPGKLKKLADENLSDKVKREIGKKIVAWNTVPMSGSNTHTALGFINKNRTEWL